MKPEIDDCWYHSRHELCKELYPGTYEYCSADYHRCVECLEDAHCPSSKPYCSWSLDCEQCLVSAHCPPGQDCMLTDGRWVCRAEDCVDLIEKGFPDYCKDRYPSTPVCDIANRVCVECLGPEDCEGEQICVNRVCVEREDRDCIDLKEAGITDFCSKNFPQSPVCHTFLRECVECQFDPDCQDGYKCADTKCIPKEWECERSEDCMSDRFKCVKHECVKKICSDYDDPDAFCNEYRGGWRCFEGECVRCIEDEDCPGGKRCMNHKCVDKTCDEYSVPDWWCRDHFGEG
ncbi:MAG: hypothetical protein U9N01_04620, partial [Euryarchaeota archaeon]|nr:hypothetical protein [Euryarchaeota archaeon]